MRHTPLSGLMLSALSACAEVSPAPSDFDLRLASKDVWSGGELTILTPVVGSGVPVFEVFFDDAPLDARRADDTTLVVPLPDLPGAHRITATAPGSDVRVVPDVVRLHGFREHFQVAPLKGNLHAWPGAGRPVVLGVGATGPALVNLATRSTQTWSDSIHDPACNLGGIGASWRPDHFIFQSRASGTCTGYRAWQLLPTPTAAADSLPTPAFSPAWGSAEVGPGQWIFTVDNDLLTFDCRSGVCGPGPDLGRIGSGDRIVLSSRGDRALINGRAHLVDTESLSLLYSFDPALWVADAAFSADGDTLLSVGVPFRSGDGPDRLLALRSSDGTILAELELRAPDGAPFSPSGIAYDPAAPWVYVAGEVPRDTLRLPALLVLERPSFRPVALVQTAPDQALGRFLPYDGLRVVPAPLEGAVFVVMQHLIYDPPQIPTVVYRFDRVP